MSGHPTVGHRGVSPSAIDELADAVGVDGAIEVIDAYVEWIDGYIRDVRDLESLGAAAHALRSTGKVLGLDALADHCEKTDLAIIGGTPVDVAEGVARLRALAAEALPYLQDGLRRLGERRATPP